MTCRITHDPPKTRGLKPHLAPTALATSNRWRSASQRAHYSTMLLGVKPTEGTGDRAQGQGPTQEAARHPSGPEPCPLIPIPCR